MKKLRLVNKGIAVLLSIISIIMTVVTKDFTFLAYILFLIPPFIFKIKPVLTLLYLVFSFTSYFLGNACALFRTTIWYDSFSHFMWGILSGLLAIYILDKFKMYDKKHKYFNLFFVLIFSLATSGLWEMCEFTTDHLFAMNTQRLETGVFDTMKDIIVTFFGNILFLVWYAFEKFSNTNGLISKFEENMNGR